MKFTITREKLQEGLVAVAASRTRQDHAARPVEHPGRGDQGRHPALRHRPRHRREHHGRRRRWTRRARSRCPPRSWSRSCASCPAPRSGSRVRRAAGDARVRPLQVQAARTLRATSSPPSRRSSSTAGWKVAVGDLQKLISARGVRGEHRGEPADPQRRALGAPARPDAHGGHQRPPAGPDGRAAWPAAARTSADLIVPPKALEQIRRLFGPTTRSRSPGATTTWASAPQSPRSSPG